MEWSQPDLPFSEPVTILPSDGRARMIFAWRGKKSGRLDRQWAAEVDDVSTVRRLLREQPDVYETQWWMDRPIRRHAFALCGTHTYADLDFYKVPALADRAPDAIGRALLHHCDETGLPRPSAIIGSGRGLYLKWCFAEPVGREHVGTMVACKPRSEGRLPGSLRRRCQGNRRDAAVARHRQHAQRRAPHGGGAAPGTARRVDDHIRPARARQSCSCRGLPTRRPWAWCWRRRTTRTGRPAAIAMRGRHRFTREGWHWALTEDMRDSARDALARHRARGMARHLRLPDRLPACPHLPARRGVRRDRRRGVDHRGCRFRPPASAAPLRHGHAAGAGRARRPQLGAYLPLRQADHDRDVTGDAGRDAAHAGADRRWRILHAGSRPRACQAGRCRGGRASGLSRRRGRAAGDGTSC